MSKSVDDLIRMAEKIKNGPDPDELFEQELETEIEKDLERFAAEEEMRRQQAFKYYPGKRPED